METFNIFLCDGTCHLLILLRSAVYVNFFVFITASKAFFHLKSMNNPKLKRKYILLALAELSNGKNGNRIKERNCMLRCTQK